MDGREAMTMSGSPSFYMQRGLAAPGPGWQSGLHSPTGIRSLSNPNPSLPVQAANVGGGSVSSTFQGESQTSISSHMGGASMGSQGGLTQGGEPVKRKRGRPRKYGLDGTVALALSPMSSTPGSGSGSGSGALTLSGSATPMQKRGRGRPPGTGRKQQLASCGELVASSAGMGFTPHVITFTAGEDIASKIMSFSQQGPRAVCILSATGSVSTVTLRQPASSGGTVTYEGRFEILSLSGSYLISDDGGSRSRSGGLSISLSSPDGRVIGGGVGGYLIAAGPVQAMVGSFIYGGAKTKSKSKPDTEAGAEEQNNSGGDQPVSSPALQPNHSMSTVQTGWSGSRQTDTRNSHFDIDLTRG